MCNPHGTDTLSHDLSTFLVPPVRLDAHMGGTLETVSEATANPATSGPTNGKSAELADLSIPLSSRWPAHQGALLPPNLVFAK